MGDEKDPRASDVVTSAPPTPVSVVPRPVSLPPRPLGNAAPTSRMPPPPSSRGIMPSIPAPGLPRSPPPPPLRNPTPVPASSSVVASPGVVPRAPATPPPPPQRTSAPPSFSRPLTYPPAGGGVTAQLEQRLGATQIELRKLGSERHTLRARLRREADRLRELESALRAEKDLRAEASDENFAAIVGLRSRLAEVEAERDSETTRLRSELDQARHELEAARSDLETARGELETARGELEQARSRASSDSDARPAPTTARASKLPQGLRRIRGIGPAYQRVLEQAGVTHVQQIAKWTDADVLAFADKLKIRPDRITKDAWISQAQALDPDPED